MSNSAVTFEAKDITGRKYWQDTLCKVFFELDLRYEDTDDKNTIGDIISRKLGPLQLNRTTAVLPHQAFRTELLISRSHQDCYWLCLVLGGNTRIIQNGHEAEMTKGDLVLIDSTRPYMIDIDRNFDGLWIGTPRSLLESRVLSINRNLGYRISSEEGIACIASRMLEAVSNQFSALNDCEGRIIANCLVDFLGTIYGNANPAKFAIPTTHRLSLLRRIEKFIDEHINDNNLCPEIIAREQDISVRYLNRLFECEGISVTRWIWMQRLEKCRRKLENPVEANLSISEIAYSCGFKNISHFNRLFKNYFGCSPRTYRSTRFKYQ